MYFSQGLEIDTNYSSKRGSQSATLLTEGPESEKTTSPAQIYYLPYVRMRIPPQFTHLQAPP